MWNIISRFLLWAPIAAAATIAFWVGSLLVAAPIWPEAKSEAEAEWAWLVWAMSTIWIPIGLVVFTLLWLFAYLVAEHRRTRAPIVTPEKEVRVRARAFADILRGRIELANDALEPSDEGKLANWHAKADRQQLFANERLEAIDLSRLPSDLAHKLELSVAIAKELNKIARQISKGKGGATPAKRVGAYRHCAVKLYRHLADIAEIDTDWRASKSNLALTPPEQISNGPSTLFPPTATQDPELMPLNTAAAQIYSEFRGKFQSHMPTLPWSDPAKALGMTAQELVGDGLVPIWGIYPPATWVEKLPDEDARTFGFSNDASEIFNQFDETRRYTNVQIAKKDFERRRCELRAKYGD